MKTEELVTMLATGAAAVPPHQVARRYLVGLIWGALGATLLMLTLLGPRHDFAVAVTLPMFWVKVAFVTSFAGASLYAAVRLAQPGAHLARIPTALGTPLAAIWLVAAFALAGADAAQRKALFFGDTWTVCPFLIATLSAPVFVSVIWVMQGLAPTRLRLAGAGAGLLAGAVGTVVYTLHCPELGAPFIGFWYLLGMLIPTAVGAALGPRLLRW